MATTTHTFPTTNPVSETPELQTYSVSHSRNLSTVSSVTLQADTSLHLTPYEPLLPPICHSSSGACDAISHQSRPSPILSPSRWSENNLRRLSLRGEKENTDGPHNRSNRLRWFKIGMETVIVSWSLYTMIRYLYAFTIYDSLNGQLATLVLGICAGLSFAFICCSIILSTVNNHLLLRGVFVKSLSSMHLILRYPPSFFFLFPAIINFVLLLIWKNTSTVDLDFRHRCQVDVDLVWTTTHVRCENPGQPWGVWVTLAIIRIVLSLIVIVAFHNIQSSQVIHMPRLSYSKTAKSRRTSPPRSTSKIPSSKEFSSIPTLTHEESGMRHRATESSLPNKSSWRHRLRSAKSSDTSEAAPSYSNTDFLPVRNAAQNDSTIMERFRRLVSMITQETDDAVAYARASVGSTSSNAQDSAESPTLNGSCQALEKESNSAEYDHIPTYDEEDDFYGSPPAEDDDHQQYPADEQIRMMNGYIKRMPTIESMGSRELVGSIGTGNTNHERNGPRPSTRNTMLSWNGTEMSGSDPRRRSLTAQAELLYGMNNASEVGELVTHGMSIKMVESGGSSGTQGERQEPLPDYHSSTSGSKNSAQTFHTAHSDVDTDDDLKISDTGDKAS